MAACSGGKKHDASSAGTSSSSSAAPATTTTTAPSTLATLTGLAVSDPAVLRRPALVVKIDGVAQARPQSGLDAADVVVEEKVEGGLVRFMAIFHSRDADPVGPVRSLRSTDPPIVKPIGGLFAYSGGIKPFIDQLHQAGVVDVGADADAGAYYRRGGRASPHNLYSSTKKLREATPAGAKPPPALFSYLAAGADFAPAGAQPATHLQATMGERASATWDWDGAAKVWRRGMDGSAHTVEGGAQLGFTNVIVQFVGYRNTGQFDVVREPVDEAVVVGAGDALVLSGGKVVAAKWSKPSPDAVTAYTDSAGAPVKLPPGQTWVMLPPVGSPAPFR